MSHCLNHRLTHVIFCLQRGRLFIVTLLCLLTMPMLVGCSTMRPSQTMQQTQRGADLLPVFARANTGEPLRAVALGGSITQAGKGWITQWLSEQFPKSHVSVYNAGMSATGSALGVFRVGRDVINFEPDLVMIEYAVNDGGQPDQTAIRNTESLVVRLKSLPHPPAIVFLEAAAKNGSKRYRHQQVSKHYNLLDVDLQVAVDTYLKKTGKSWDSIMGDAVHPNKDGHALYSKVIAEKLQPFVDQARKLSPNISAPGIAGIKPLSDKPLILDGCMMPIGATKDWKQINSLPYWWDRFFNGVVRGTESGSELIIPARGSTIGLYYALDSKAGGLCYASIDGNTPSVIDTSSRMGYTYSILGNDLQSCEHVLRLAVAKPLDKPAGNVDIGYVLVAGQTHSLRKIAPQKPLNLASLAARTFDPIAASRWQWAGPFGGTELTGAGPTSDFDKTFIPETQPDQADWENGQGDDAKVDFAKLTGWSDRGVCYARSTIHRSQAGKVMLALRLDYFAKVFVNGKLAYTIDRSKHHGGPNKPILIPVQLQAGDNPIMIKLNSGSRGNMFALFVESEK